MSDETKKKKKKKKKKASALAPPAPPREEAAELRDDTATDEPKPSDPKLDVPPEVAHDDREIDHGAVIRFGAILAVVTALVLGAMWSFTRQMEHASLEGAPEPPPMASELPIGPPDPKLQPHPRDGLAALREAEKRDLESYGWVDQKGRVARIPIDRAMDILAERGLPTRQMGPREEERVTQPTDGSLEPPHEDLK